MPPWVSLNSRRALAEACAARTASGLPELSSMRAATNMRFSDAMLWDLPQVRLSRRFNVLLLRRGELTSILGVGMFYREILQGVSC